MCVLSDLTASPGWREKVVVYYYLSLQNLYCICSVDLLISLLHLYCFSNNTAFDQLLDS